MTHYTHNPGVKQLFSDWIRNQLRHYSWILSRRLEEFSKTV